ncbi:MAG TPA: hypothetical protein VGO98_01590 [Candidatus Saccharimonadales bacterium]|nr:hypothetical protein [Candidatus Saccharimonadales bacterium]
MLHHIQKSILDNLATSESSRYSDLKPKDMDGNIFSYHLKLLVADHYALKNNDGSYTLTHKGKDYIVHRYEDALSRAHSIFLITIRRGDEWLMRERLVQPLLGMSGFIHGEPVASEPLLETATKRLKEKTGLSLPLSIHSSGLIRILRNDNVESFSHAIIFTGETNDTIITHEDRTGRNYWLATADMKKDDILPSCSDIVALLSHKRYSPFEFTYRL